MHSKAPQSLRYGAALLATLQVFTGFPTPAYAQDNDHAKDNSLKTKTPIKHVIVIIGENRTFDHVFATYVPQSRDSVANLLSKGIVNADGTPGPNFSKAAQFQAIPPFKTKYYISLGKSDKAAYSTLPLPGLNFSPTGNEAATAAAFAANGVI